MSGHDVIQLDVGRLCCRSLRDYLGAMKVAGHDVQWHEGGGLFERKFTINLGSWDARLVLLHWIRATSHPQDVR